MELDAKLHQITYIQISSNLSYAIYIYNENINVYPYLIDKNICNMIKLIEFS